MRRGFLLGKSILNKDFFDNRIDQVLVSLLINRISAHVINDFAQGVCLDEHRNRFGVNVLVIEVSLLRLTDNVS